MQKRNVKQPIIRTSTLILLIVYTLLYLSFFYLLDNQTQAGFGLLEVGLGSILALVTVFVLIWIQSIILIRPWLGMILMLTGSIIAVAAVITQFKGVYTYSFTIVGTLIAVMYLAVSVAKTHHSAS